MKLKSYVLLVFTALATMYAFFAPDAKRFVRPEGARIIFFHLPCAFITSGLLFLMGYFGYQYLRTRKPEWDHRCSAATELGAVLAILTMATGMVFSRVQWGAWWQNDPRQTSFLMVLLLFLAGLALQGGIIDEKKRAAATAGYAVFTQLTGLFLIFVFPRIPYIERNSFHPSQTIVQRGFDLYYTLGLLLLFTALTSITVTVYRMRVRLAKLESDLEDRNGLLENSGGHSTVTGVVRPVSVPKEP